MFVGLVARLLKTFESEGELSPAIDERQLDSSRVGRDRGPLDDLVRIVLDQHVVLEGRGLALVTVHDEVGRGCPPQHRPLATRREAGPAASEQARLVDFGGDLRGRHRQGLTKTLVPTGGQVTLECERVRELYTRGDDPGRSGDHSGTAPVAAPDCLPATVPNL